MLIAEALKILNKYISLITFRYINCPYGMLESASSVQRNEIQVLWSLRSYYSNTGFSDKMNVCLFVCLSVVIFSCVKQVYTRIQDTSVWNEREHIQTLHNLNDDAVLVFQIQSECNGC